MPFSYRQGWDDNKKQFPVKSHLADMVHCKAVTFLSNQGLGAFSPSELPYPPKASAFEARQLKHRLKKSPRVLKGTKQKSWLEFCHQDLHAERRHYQQHICLAAETAKFANIAALTCLNVVRFSSFGSNALN